ncbi:MAG: hypothetical protein F4213_05585 [Boseongicola sp. SB0677_bin_26]|nr:hypothetical protein [Boseongicola sp. SB0665_bin_10]MYG25478.1 hypothetical protein [Boseongicola sp. SB0677_bin_26]
MFPFAATPGISVLALALMAPLGAILAWMFLRDLRFFVIDYVPLAAVTALMAIIVVLLEGTMALLPSFAIGTGSATVAALARRVWRRGMGSGDPWIFGTLGIAAGPEHLVPALTCLCTLACAISAAWSLSRGKRLFRSMFPVGAAMYPAMAFGMALRLWNASGTMPPTLDLTSMPMDSIAALWIMAICIPLLVGLVMLPAGRR